MKRCPYCAEEIQDEAIVCRFCGRAVSPAGETAPPPVANAPADEALQYTHSGRRYLLGYGHDYFGIWDRQRPGAPIARYPRTDDGWRAAWLAFHTDEPDAAEVGLSAGRPIKSPSTAAYAGAGPFAPTRRDVSNAWWLLPIFMGWLGGVIAWLVNKDIDPDKARAMLVTGIVISVALFVLAFGLTAAVAF